MINNNCHIKEARGNGTKCIGLSIKLKQDGDLHYTNWNGRLIHSISVLDVEYILCETIPEK